MVQTPTCFKCLFKILWYNSHNKFRLPSSDLCQVGCLLYTHESIIHAFLSSFYEECFASFFKLESFSPIYCNSMSLFSSICLLLFSMDDNFFWWTVPLMEVKETYFWKHNFVLTTLFSYTRHSHGGNHSNDCPNH